MTGKITETGLSTEARMRAHFLEQESKTIDLIRTNYQIIDKDRINDPECVPYDLPSNNIGLCLNHKKNELYQQFKKANLNYFYSNICGMAITRDLLETIDLGLIPYNQMIICATEITNRISEHKMLLRSPFFNRLKALIKEPNYVNNYTGFLKTKATQFASLSLSYILYCKYIDDYSLETNISSALTEFLLKNVKAQDVRDLYYDEIIDTYTKLGFASQLPDLKEQIESAYRVRNEDAISRLKKLGIEDCEQFVPNLSEENPSISLKKLNEYSELFAGLAQVKNNVDIEIKNEDIN